MNQDVHFRRLQEWSRLVLEAENSGSKIAWCKENGIDYRKYMYWQNLVRKYLIKHGDNSLSEAAPQQPAVSEGSHQLVDVTAVVERSLSKNTDQHDPAPVSQETMSDIVLEYNGFRIYVNDGISEKTLKTVLKAVRHA